MTGYHQGRKEGREGWKKEPVTVHIKAEEEETVYAVSVILAKVLFLAILNSIRKNNTTKEGRKGWKKEPVTVHIKAEEEETVYAVSVILAKVLFSAGSITINHYTKCQISPNK